MHQKKKEVKRGNIGGTRIRDIHTLLYIYMVALEADERKCMIQMSEVEWQR